MRLDLFLAGAIPEVSRSQLTRHIAQGAVTVNGAVFPPSRKLRAGDVVVWTPPPVVNTELAAEEIPLVVVHEDRWLVVIDKPAGLVVHPAPGHEAGTLVNALLAHCRDLRGIGGELRPGSSTASTRTPRGCWSSPRTTPDHEGAGRGLQGARHRAAVRRAGGGPAAGGERRIDTLHGRDPRDRKKFSIRVKEGRRAVTNWRLVERFAGAARIEAELETGRTHQVRVHLAALGCPLLGDQTYGRPPRDPRLRAIAEALGRQALHARTLGFVHPATGKAMSFSSTPPEDFQRALEALRATIGRP